jgi:type IV fimbrial biogenesis protein FimT
MDKRTQAGFTLYELLITVLIVGVILSFGIPNMRTFAQNSRITSAANDLHSAFHLARSESSRAKTNITICASANSMTAGANCGGTFDQGFIVFVDVDGDINRDGGDETVLRAHPAIDPSLSYAVARDATYFSYSSTGLGRPNVDDKTAVTQIAICDERGSSQGPADDSTARLFVVTPLGRGTVYRRKELVDRALQEMEKTCP